MTLGLWVQRTPHELAALGAVVGARLLTHPDAVTRGEIQRVAEATLMIDTGADVTMVDEDVCRGVLGPPIGMRQVVGISGLVETYGLYQATIAIPVRVARDAAEQHPIAYSGQVVGMPPQPHDLGHVGVLGRDFLAHFRLVYVGTEGEFMLRVPAAPDPNLIVDASALAAARVHDARQKKKQRARR